MLTVELIQELHKLTQAEKLRAIQLLADDLARDEALRNSTVQRKTWSPYDTAVAAETLMQMLEEVQ